MKTASLFGLLLAAPLAPLMAEPMPDVAAEVTLLPGWQMDNGHHMTALKVTLPEGWKTYWRAPGDAGIPPEFDWAGSTNLAEVSFHWPTPEAMPTGSMTTVGYRYELVLPIEVVPTDARADVVLSADLILGVCEEICMPVMEMVGVTLNAAQAAPNAEITRALDARPHTSAEAGLVTAQCRTEPLDDGTRVIATLDLPPLPGEEYVVFEPARPGVWVSEFMGGRDGSGPLVVEADFVPPEGKPFDMAGEDIRITVLGAGRAVDIQGCELID